MFLLWREHYLQILRQQIFTADITKELLHIEKYRLIVVLGPAQTICTTIFHNIPDIRWKGSRRRGKWLIFVIRFLNTASNMAFFYGVSTVQRSPRWNPEFSRLHFHTCFDEYLRKYGDGELAVINLVMSPSRVTLKSHDYVDCWNRMLKCKHLKINLNNKYPVLEFLLASE